MCRAAHLPNARRCPSHRNPSPERRESASAAKARRRGQVKSLKLGLQSINRGDLSVVVDEVPPSQLSYVMDVLGIPASVAKDGLPNLPDSQIATEKGRIKADIALVGALPFSVNGNPTTETLTKGTVQERTELLEEFQYFTEERWKVLSDRGLTPSKKEVNSITELETLLPPTTYEAAMDGLPVTVTQYGNEYAAVERQSGMVTLHDFSKRGVIGFGPVKETASSFDSLRGLSFYPGTVTPTIPSDVVTTARDMRLGKIAGSTKNGKSFSLPATSIRAALASEGLRSALRELHGDTPVTRLGIPLLSSGALVASKERRVFHYDSPILDFDEPSRFYETQSIKSEVDTSHLFHVGTGSVMFFTEEGYVGMNKEIVDGVSFEPSEEGSSYATLYQDHIDELHGVIHDIDSLNFANPDVKTIVRGVSVSNKQNLEDMYKTGSEISFPAFSSFTTSKDVAQKFSTKHQDQAPCILVAHTREGVDVSGVSLHSGEEEIVVNRDTHFRVLGTTTDVNTGFPVVHLASQEIASELLYDTESVVR